MKTATFIVELLALATFAVAVPQGPVSSCTTTVQPPPPTSCPVYQHTVTSTESVNCSGCKLVTAPHGPGIECTTPKTLSAGTATDTTIVCAASPKP